MEVIIMTSRELLSTVSELRELRNMAAELADQISALETIVKNEMDAQGVDKLYIGTCKVSYTKFMTKRFDSKTFKAANEELYNQYLKDTPSSRFSVS